MKPAINKYLCMNFFLPLRNWERIAFRANPETEMPETEVIAAGSDKKDLSAIKPNLLIALLKFFRQTNCD